MTWYDDPSVVHFDVHAGASPAEWFRFQAPPGLRAFDATNVTTYAGTPRNPGNVNDVGASARFSAPQGVAVSGGYAYVADTGNGALRKVSLTHLSVLPQQ
mgnify:CR=1 FL=1